MHEPVESNPYQCVHNMVTDLCGQCIREERAAKEQQRIAETREALLEHTTTNDEEQHRGRT